MEKHNKEGFDCSITLTKKGNSITAVTQNMGLSVKCVTTINDGTDTIYVALTETSALSLISVYTSDRM